MKKYRLLIFTLVLFQTCIVAQSIEELVEMATTYNPGLKALRMDYEASLQKVNQVNEWPDPKVNLALGILPVETRLGAQRFKIGVSQMIPWKGALDAKGDVARSMAEVKSYADDVQEIDIEYAIRTSYAMLQFLASKKDIIGERLEVLDILEELSKSAVRAGKGKLSNVLFTERKREALEADISLINKRIEQPTIMINRWTGRPLSTDIILSSKEYVPFSKEEIINYAETNHPQYKVFENQIGASNAKITMLDFSKKPTIGVGLDYAYIDARNDVDIPHNGRDVLMPMGSITIPIHTDRFKSVRQEEQIRQEAISARIEEVGDMFKAEIELAYSTTEYANILIDKYTGLKMITMETLTLMRTEYASEGTRFEELLRLEMELIDYDLEILKAQYEMRLANATLNKFN